MCRQMRQLICTKRLYSSCYIKSGNSQNRTVVLYAHEHYLSHLCTLSVGDWCFCCFRPSGDVERSFKLFSICFFYYKLYGTLGRMEKRHCPVWLNLMPAGGTCECFVPTTTSMDHCFDKCSHYNRLHRDVTNIQCFFSPLRSMACPHRWLCGVCTADCHGD